MSNKEISKILRLNAALGELHGENEFKLKSLVNGAFQIDRLGTQLQDFTPEQLLQIPGIGKGLAQKIDEILQKGTTNELEQLKDKTPSGIIELLSIKGIGPKKILTVWKELGIESPGELLYACNENRLVELKGFGEKTQLQISKTLQYSLASRGKFHYQDALRIAEEIIRLLKAQDSSLHILIAGELRRNLETCTELTLLIVQEEEVVRNLIAQLPALVIQQHENNSFTCLLEERYTVRLICTDVTYFSVDLFRHTGPDEHLTALKIDAGKLYESEEAIYLQHGLPFILPELRDLPIAQAKEINLTTLVSKSDIRGCIHAHSTWSDGSNSIREMAEECIKLGFEYLAITDHSKSASYARGLSVDNVLRQHDEIDLLNQQLAPFRIFKGIESDILVNGDLDYPDNILSRFELVIASVHSVLRMDRQKATSRILAAIENPFTTMLGHPSGRLLLSREAYPLDYEVLIEAAAKNNVVFELNANRFRMDIDWRYLPLCGKHGVRISVNPDAHQKETITDMYFGIDIARKGGLTNTMLFNGLSQTELSDFLKSKICK